MEAEIKKHKRKGKEDVAANVAAQKKEAEVRANAASEVLGNIKVLGSFGLAWTEGEADRSTAAAAAIVTQIIADTSLVSSRACRATHIWSLLSAHHRRRPALSLTAILRVLLAACPATNMQEDLSSSVVMVDDLSSSVVVVEKPPSLPSSADSSSGTHFDTANLYSACTSW